VARKQRIFRDGLFLVAFFVLLILIAAKLDQSGDAVLAGPFYVIDGDTLAAGDERLRLEGIDAPEIDQTCQDGQGMAWPCGRDAKARLAALITEKGVECRGQDRDRYRRLLVRCHSGTLSINAVMVEEGLAVASGNYRDEEQAARVQERGLWAGTFVFPRDFRAARGMMEDPGIIASVAEWLKGLMRHE
jgi:endonuclease YncB( thermonuclease family)